MQNESSLYLWFFRHCGGLELHVSGTCHSILNNSKGAANYEQVNYGNILHVSPAHGDRRRLQDEGVLLDAVLQRQRGEVHGERRRPREPLAHGLLAGACGVGRMAARLVRQRPLRPAADLFAIQGPRRIRLQRVQSSLADWTVRHPQPRLSHLSALLGEELLGQSVFLPIPRAVARRRNHWHLPLLLERLA